MGDGEKMQDTLFVGNFMNFYFVFVYVVVLDQYSMSYGQKTDDFCPL